MLNSPSILLIFSYFTCRSTYTFTIVVYDIFNSLQRNLFVVKKYIFFFNFDNRKF